MTNVCYTCSSWSKHENRKTPEMPAKRWNNNNNNKHQQYRAGLCDSHTKWLRRKWRIKKEEYEEVEEEEEDAGKQANKFIRIQTVSRALCFVPLLLLLFCFYLTLSCITRCFLSHTNTPLYRIYMLWTLTCDELMCFTLQCIQTIRHSAIRSKMANNSFVLLVLCKRMKINKCPLLHAENLHSLPLYFSSFSS